MRNDLPATDADATLPPSAPSEQATLPPVDSSLTLAPSEAPPLPRSGVVVPGYEVIRELGRGGMGVVYMARHLALGRVVALKMILSGAHAGEAELGRFRAEAEAVARLQHPGIVQVFEVGSHDGLPYFALEFCAGGSLDARLRGEPMRPADAAALVERLARAMHEAHLAGVAHRDLKPANVLLGADGTPKVTDFGLAKRLDGTGQTQTGAVMGTPSYMAPEQAEGRKDVGAPADVYALGAILYECLAGRPPFRAASAFDTILQVIGDEPAALRQLNAGVPRDLETVCHKCLRKRPAERYADAAALAEDLGRFQRGEPIAARPVGRVERAAKWVRRNPVLAGAGAAVVMALVTGTVVSTYFGMTAVEESKTAKRHLDEATTARGKLEVATKELAAKSDSLETTLARSLLRPLKPSKPGTKEDTTAMEWQALWEVAESRSDRLRYRFLKEAMRRPETTRQLRNRSALAFDAAVGLDERRREVVERLLLSRLDDPGMSAAQRTDLVLAASAWAGLSEETARRVGQELIGRMRTDSAGADNFPLSPLVDGLLTVTTCMSAGDATTDLARAAALLLDFMKQSADYTQQERTKLLLEIAACLEAKEAAAIYAQAATILLRQWKDTLDFFPLSTQAEALEAVIVRMDARDAAAVSKQASLRLLPAMEGLKDVDMLSKLASCLSKLADRMEAKDAADVAARAAAALVRALENTTNPYGLHSVEGPLSALMGKLSTTEVERIATVLFRLVKETREPQKQSWLLNCLAVVAKHLDAAEAARTAPTLIQLMKVTKEPVVFGSLQMCLEVVASRMEAADATRIATSLVEEIKGTKEPFALSMRAICLAMLTNRIDAADAAAISASIVPRLLESMQGAGPGDSFYLGCAMSIVTPRLRSNAAAAVAPRIEVFLNHALKDPGRLIAVPPLVVALSAATARMEPGDAIAISRRAATAILQAMNHTKDPEVLSSLAQWFADVSDRSQPQARSRVATSLLAAMKDAKDGWKREMLARPLSDVATGMDAEEAAIALSTAARLLIDAENPSNRSPDQLLLSALLSPGILSRQHSRYSASAAAVAFLVGPGQRLGAIASLFAVMRRPCPLSTQQLVELLKMPTCYGQSRRVVLDQLGNRYRRPFRDQWAFVRFATEQKLGLDFTSPPTRPEVEPHAR